MVKMGPAQVAKRLDREGRHETWRRKERNFFIVPKRGEGRGKCTDGRAEETAL